MSTSAPQTASCVAVKQDHFLFSSRRRHTRSLRDRSSDVCSSDLYVVVTPTDRGNSPPRPPRAHAYRVLLPVVTREQYRGGHGSAPVGARRHLLPRPPAAGRRSEERRVGKERSARTWSSQS